MRRLVLTALVLLPALAFAQTSNSAASQSSAPSNLQAKLSAPAGLPPAAAKPAAIDANSVFIPIHETVVDNRDSGDAEIDAVGIRPSTLAQLVKTTPLTLSLKDMRSEAAVNVVTVRMTVAADGTPRDLSIVHSGGAALDQRALEAVSQYRFKPATRNYLPVTSDISISIQIKKS